MKKIALLFISSLLWGLVYAQQPPLYRSRVLNAVNLSDSSGKLLDIREKLVQLAMQNPSIEVDDRTVNIAVYNVKKAKSNILGNISLQGNLNEYSIKPNTVGGNLYPRYNIGATLPLGLFITRSHDVNIAKESLNISIAQRNEHSRILRRNVLSKYEDFLMATDLLKFQRQVVEDVYTSYLKAEKDFAEARIKADEYSRAYREYNLELAKQRSLERDLKVVVIELESYIGTRLEDVLKDFK